MTRTCVACKETFEDAVATICPHERFISDEKAKQKDLAVSLIGKDPDRTWGRTLG